jgi:hypothetical protein
LSVGRSSFEFEQQPDGAIDLVCEPGSEPDHGRRSFHGRAEGMNSNLQFDYISIGHVTIDVLEDGSRRPGGTALYSALQAARLGLRAKIVTRGLPAELEDLLEPWAAELELEIQPAPATTSLATRGQGSGRRQELLAWAGPLEPVGSMSCAIVHLAPVAAELPVPWPAGGGLRGITPQGLARAWSNAGGIVSPARPSAAAALEARRTDVVVVSDDERPLCEALIESARGNGALLAVTAGERPSTILAAGGQALTLAVHPLEHPADDLGAGDVFASALFTGLAEGRSPAQAGTFANTAAALRMSGRGVDAVAGRAEIEAALPR